MAFPRRKISKVADLLDIGIAEDVETDVCQIWENCHIYNEKGSTITKLARMTEAYFNEMWSMHVRSTTSAEQPGSSKEHFTASLEAQTGALPQVNNYVNIIHESNLLGPFSNGVCRPFCSFQNSDTVTGFLHASSHKHL